MTRMTRRHCVAAGALACVVAAATSRPGRTEGQGSPIYGVTIPAGYRQWAMIAPSHEAGLDELRVILGNGMATGAYRDATLPFPDGTILVKLAWKHVPLADIAGSLRSRARHHGPDHGQGLEAVRRHRRLGLRPLHQRRAGGRGTASHVLRLP